MAFNPNGHVPVGTGQQVPVMQPNIVVANPNGQLARQRAGRVQATVYQHIGAYAQQRSSVPAREIQARQIPGSGSANIVFSNSANRR